jgi:hypothetical protein
LKNGKVLHGMKEERNMLNTLKRRQVNCSGYTSRRNCFLKHVIQRKTEVTGTRRLRRKQPLDDLKEMRGCWKF